MILKAARTGVALLALAAATALATGCGGVPGNAIAEVDGAPIDKKTYDHWLNIAARSSGQPNATVPDPPEFAKCVEQKRKTTPKPAKGQPEVTNDQLKSQCEQEYEALRDQVVQLLVSYEWIQGEAEEQGVSVTDDEIKKSFEEQKKQSFPKEEDYEKFLKDTGQTQEDILLRVRLDLLSNKIREKVVKGKDQVSDAQIQKFYEENKERFAQPEKRDLRVVLTKKKAQASKAKAAIDDGQSWKKVAKQYSIDEASKAQGGKLPGQAKGTLEKSLDEGVFAADKGQVIGPVKTQFGFYVFEVEKVTPASQQSLEEAKQTIRQTLQSQNQQKALDAFVEDFRKRWKEKTECREGYITQDCKNAPKEEASPTPAPGAPTQPTQPTQPAQPQPSEPQR
jgi:foldase protein PrsA